MEHGLPGLLRSLWVTTRACCYAVTVFDAAEAGPVPRAFVARTVHEYVLPTVRPPTVMGLAMPVADLVTPPLDDVQVTR